jgi:hypothetical protein
MNNENKIKDELVSENKPRKNKTDEKTLHQFLIENPELIAELEDWRETVGSVALFALISIPLEKVRENILAIVNEEKNK